MDEQAIKTQAGDAMKKAAALRALENLENGADAAVSVGRWVRTLAAEEARDGGTFAEAIELKPDAAQWGSFGRETFGSLYGLGVEAVDAAKAPAGAQWVRELLKQAESLPEWQDLQHRADGDAWAAGVAAAGALEALAPHVTPPKEDAQELKAQADALEEMIRDTGKKPSRGAAKRLAALRQSQATAEAEDAAAAQAIRRSAATVRSALRGAAAEASEEIEETQNAETGLSGIGGRMTAATAAPPNKVREAVRENEHLRKIAALAGRFRRRAAQKQAEKAKGGRSEVCDVATGNDLARLLPSEAVLAGDPDVEVLLYRKLMEHSAAVYELRAPATKTNGPLIVCVDESGSMSGSPDVWAKAACLALLEIAARQNRPFAIVHFDDGVSRTDLFKNPRAVPFESIIEAVCAFSGGGTDIGKAMEHGLSLIASEKTYAKADLVVVTDGYDDWDRIGKVVQAAKEKAVSTHWVSIGGADNSAMVREKLHVATCAHVSGTAIHAEDVTAIDAALTEV